jgi:hypothetical protein
MTAVGDIVLIAFPFTDLSATKFAQPLWSVTPEPWM